MKVDAHDPGRADALADDLRRAGCLPSRVGATALTVAYPDAHDEREEEIELAFYVKAWAAANGAATP